MHNQFTTGLGVPQKIPPIPYKPQLNKWNEIPQVRTTKSFSVTNLYPPDSLDYYGAEIAFHSQATQSPFYTALLGKARPSQNLMAQLRSLQQHYTILDDDCLITEILAEETSLYTLLIEAIKPLQHAFGEKRIIHLRIQSSEDDMIVKVAVQLPADFGDDPERALQSFDEEWWLNNCHRSDGALVFDYEIA